MTYEYTKCDICDKLITDATERELIRLKLRASERKKNSIFPSGKYNIGTDSLSLSDICPDCGKKIVTYLQRISNHRIDNRFM